MENTLTIDGKLYEELRERAEAEELPLEQFADRIIRAGMKTAAEQHRFTQQTHSMGAKVDISRINEFDAEQEAEEFIRKMKLGQ